MLSCSLFQLTTSIETFIITSGKTLLTVPRQPIHAIEGKSVFHERAMPSLKKPHTLISGNDQNSKVSVSKLSTDSYSDCNNSL